MSLILSTLPGDAEGRRADCVRLTNRSGAYVELTNYGARVVSVCVPDRAGRIGHVVLGFPSAEGYAQDSCYIGATVGRFANRIRNASFALDGISFRLDANEAPNHNHGGFQGFDRKFFITRTEEDTVHFDLLSEDGDGGYPGTLALTVSYTWTDAHELQIRYSAVTDQPTLANLTNHSYFCLGQPVAGHVLTLRADAFLETDGRHIPTGRFTPLPARTFRLGDQDSLNTCYVLTDEPGPVATLSHPETGRKLEVFTTYPGLLVYTGEYLGSTVPGHEGKPYGPFDGLCLECQYFPDSPNQPAFPSPVLRPGERYEQSISFRFSLL